MSTAAPRSDALLDAVTVALALWTLCAHAAVAAGGHLGHLLAGFAGVAVGVGSIAVGWRRRGSGPQVQPSSPSPPQELRRGEDRRSADLVPAALGGVAAVGAVLAVIWHRDVVWLWLSAVALLAAAAVRFVWLEAPRFERPAASRRLEFSLWALALLCVGVTLVTHRPDPDDSFYVNVAVTVADAPTRTLLAEDSLHGIEGLPLHQPIYRVHSYELLAGAVSYLTGIPALHVFHFGMAALWALLVPLANARLLRWLAPRRWLWATAALVLVLVAVGETHRWYSNFAFVRMWQGKSVYLFVFQPLLYANALAFAAAPGPRRFALLAATLIASVGISSSALWAGPVAVGLAMCCAVRPDRRGLALLACGALASLYVLGAGWWLMQGDIAAHDPLLERARVRAAAVVHPPGQELAGALETVLGNARLQAVALAVMLGGWAVCGRGLARRFAIVVPLAVWVVLLNPFLQEWLTRTLTGPSYWRVLWCVPVPLLLALVITSPLGLSSPRGLGPVLAAGLAALVAFLVPAYSVLSAQNRPLEVLGDPWLGRPALKVPGGPPPTSYDWALALKENSGPGEAVLAPEYISAWIPTLHHPPHPLLVRESYLRKFLDRLGREEVRPRRVMTRYVEGSVLQTDAADVFRAGIERFDLRAVCFALGPRAAETRAILRQEGFELRLPGRAHELWVRGN